MPSKNTRDAARARRPARTAGDLPARDLDESRGLSERPVKLVPGRRLPREVVVQSQRERLMISMIELVDRNGYPKTSVAGLASHSHVSREAFYEHFTGIRDCFMHAYNIQISRWTAQLVSAYNTPGLKTAQRTQAIVQAYARVTGSWPSATRVCLRHILTVEHGAIERRTHAQRAARAILRDAMGARGIPEALTPVLTTATIGATRRLTYRHVHDATGERSHDELTETLTRWLDSYKPPKSSASAPKRAAGAAKRKAPAARTAGGAPGAAADPVEDDEPRARIMRAVLELCATKGYAAMTHRDIARTAAVAFGTFYKNFPDKQSALLAVCEQINDKLTADTRRAASAAAEHWPTAIREGLVAHLNTLAADPPATRVLALQTLALGHTGLDFRDKRAQDIKRLLAHVPAAERPPHADTLAEGLAGAILETVHEHALANEIERLPKLAPALTYILLAPYIGPRDAALIGGAPEQP